MKITHSVVKLVALGLLLTLASCKARTQNAAVRSDDTGAEPNPDATPDAEQTEAVQIGGGAAAMALPLLRVTNADLPAIEAAVRAVLTKNKVGPDVAAAIAPKLARYLAFLGLKPAAAAHAKPDDFDKVLTRLLESSTQFLTCPDFVDWTCLERDPQLTPKVEFRQATAAGLGTPVDAGAAFKAEWFFTQQWDKTFNPNGTSMARNLAEKISTNGIRSISMAAYGIRAIAASIKPVWDALNARIRAGTPVRAVVDQKGYLHSKFDILFAYGQPTSSALGSGTSRKVWSFAKPNPDEIVPTLAEGVDSVGAGAAGGPAQAAQQGAGADADDGSDEGDDEEAPTQDQWMSFEYSNTPDLLQLLNGNSTDPAAAKARVEWPSTSIMHNKFFVLERAQGAKSVWTGTTNISDTCMGEERNSNFGIWVDNDAVASTYLAEFEEMYQYDPAAKVSVRASTTPFPVGRFHHNKRPNTRRFFRYGDGTELRVHFAPTDDAEHRALVPLLLSAQAGDRIRISMFGSSGLELVRALQFAAFKGAQVQVLLDKQQGAGLSSWARAANGNLGDDNPYGAGTGSLEFKLNTWEGKNHHKSATLTRANGVAEILVTGSQNWSVGGNDKNDENMLTIRNIGKGLAPARDFNDHFDTRLWPNGVVRRFRRAGAAATAE